MVIPLPVPPAPSGTVTPTALCDWLTQATGTAHTFANDLKDYPVFLSVRGGSPGRIEALVATALAGRWERDGATLRLTPVRPAKDEGLGEFDRAWRLAAAKRPNLAGLPTRDLYAMRSGEIVRFGAVPGPYVRPLPDALRKKVEASDAKVGEIAVRRFTNGSFETKLTMPDERKGVFSGDSQVEFGSLPPEVDAALGDEARTKVLSPEDTAAIRRITANPAAAKTDPKTFAQVDPLARFADPVLVPLSKGLKEDLVVALPDFAILGLMGNAAGTVGDVMRTFSEFDDWTVGDGALVGRLPASERRYRTQTRRGVLASFLRSAQETGVPSPVALTDYLQAQRPGASESWVDTILLTFSGITIDETHLGDFPFNLRLGAALTPADWTRLRSGGTLSAADLTPLAREALVALLVQSRERMGSDGPDPVVQWRGFPNVPLAITAKVEEDDVLVGFRSGLTNVMSIDEAGNGYPSAKKTLGTEPLYRPAHRRKLELTIAPQGSGEPVGTGFAEVILDPKARAVPWTELPPGLRAAFEKGMRGHEVGAPPAAVPG